MHMPHLTINRNQAARNTQELKQKEFKKGKRAQINHLTFQAKKMPFMKETRLCYYTQPKEIMLVHCSCGGWVNFNLCQMVWSCQLLYINVLTFLRLLISVTRFFLPHSVEIGSKIKSDTLYLLYNLGSLSEKKMKFKLLTFKSGVLKAKIVNPIITEWLFHIFPSH